MFMNAKIGVLANSILTFLSWFGRYGASQRAHVFLLSQANPDISINRLCLLATSLVLSVSRATVFMILWQLLCLVIGNTARAQ